MSTEIVAKVNKEELSSEHITFTTYGVEFTDNERPTIEEWHKAVLKVQSVHGMLQFYLGDLAVFADSEVTGWGESKYQSLIDASGLEWDTVKTYAVVSRRFPESFREEILKDSDPDHYVSWTHFRMVTSLPDEHAKYFLRLVRDGRWTKSKLAEEITRYKNGGQLPEPEEKEERPVGYVSFKNQMKSFFSGWVPNIVNREYTRKEFLLEVRDTINEELERL